MLRIEQPVPLKGTTQRFQAKSPDAARPCEIPSWHRVDLPELAEYLFETNSVYVKFYGIELLRQFSTVATRNVRCCAIVPNEFLKLITLVHGQAEQL